MNQRHAYLLACSSLIILIFLCAAWELRLAPLRPEGSALVFKALPLLAPLFGILHGRRYTYQWSTLLILLYFAEGLVRATTESGLGQWLAGIEVVLSVSFFVAAIFYIRQSRSDRTPAPPAPSSGGREAGPGA